DFQIVIMTKGWARFMYEDKETLVEAGDVVHQAPGIRHYLFDYSPDMEYLEIVSPANFKSVEVAPVCEIPPPTPWK
ncbi:MAG: cupin domain-containing protein, partial [Polaromonas sp.]